MGGLLGGLPLQEGDPRQVGQTVRHARLLVERSEPVGVLAALLVLAWWLFHELLELKPWARTVLLVVAWISAASAAVNVLGAPAASAMAPWLERYAVGIDFARLMPLSLLGNVLSLAAWGDVIRTPLSADVRAAFRRARGESH